MTKQQIMQRDREAITTIANHTLGAASIPLDVSDDAVALAYYRTADQLEEMVTRCRAMAKIYSGIVA